VTPDRRSYDARLADADPLLDPDCRDGKHASCTGGPCECLCHRDDP
jgi:hypothetical protein